MILDLPDELAGAYLDAMSPDDHPAKIELGDRISDALYRTCPACGRQSRQATECDACTTAGHQAGRLPMKEG
jgi:hypothetical protein